MNTNSIYFGAIADFVKSDPYIQRITRHIESCIESEHRNFPGMIKIHEIEESELKRLQSGPAYDYQFRWGDKMDGPFMAVVRFRDVSQTGGVLILFASTFTPDGSMVVRGVSPTAKFWQSSPEYRAKFEEVFVSMLQRRAMLDLAETKGTGEMRLTEAQQTALYTIKLAELAMSDPDAIYDVDSDGIAAIVSLRKDSILVDHAALSQRGEEIAMRALKSVLSGGVPPRLVLPYFEATRFYEGGSATKLSVYHTEIDEEGTNFAIYSDVSTEGSWDGAPVFYQKGTAFSWLHFPNVAFRELVIKGKEVPPVKEFSSAA